MKKALALCIALLAVVLLFSACGDSLSDEDFIGTWEDGRGDAGFRVIIRSDGTGEHQTPRGYDRGRERVVTGHTIVTFDWERHGNNLNIVLANVIEEEMQLSINRGILRFGNLLTEFRRVSLTY